MKYVLGIDQGGTKTAAAVADCSGHILGSGRSRGAYHPADGIENTVGAIAAAAAAALAQAGLQYADIDTVGAGITGMDWPEDHELLYPAIAVLTGAPHIRVFNDAVGALYSGTVRNNAAVLCVGTGLNAAVRSPDGEEFILGFYIDDDDQGGGALAKRAIMRVFHSAIGLYDPTRLTQLFLDAAGASNVDELLHTFTVDEAFQSSIKDMVPRIETIAEEGDAVTVALMREYAGSLSRYIYAGLKRFDMLGLDTEIVLSGSVLKGKGNVLTADISQEIARFAPYARIINARFEPVVGTVAAALVACGCFDGADPLVGSNLARTAAEQNLLRNAG